MDNNLFQRPVTVAGRPLSDFGAKMQSWPSFSKTMDVEVFQSRGRASMQPLKHETSAMFMRAFVDFWGDNAERIRNQSRFEALFAKDTETVEINIQDGFWYRAVLISSGESSTQHELFTTVEYRFQVTRHKDPVSVDLSNPNVLIWCTSNVRKTDCVITIPESYLEDCEYSIHVVLNGLEWWYDPNDGNTGDLILDGINKVFKRGATNITNAVEWTDFPYLVPEENEIKVYVDGAWPLTTAHVEYTPTFA